MKRDRKPTYSEMLEETCSQVERASEKAAATKEADYLGRAMVLWADADRAMERGQFGWASLFAACLGVGMGGGTLFYTGAVHADGGLSITGALLLVVCVPLAVLSAARFAALAKASRRVREAVRSARTEVLEAEGGEIEEPALALRVVQAAIFAVVTIGAWLLVFQVVAGVAGRLESLLFSMF